MPVYTYHAVDDKGKRFTGTMPADSEANLDTRLSATGMWLVEAKLLRAPSAMDDSASMGRITGFKRAKRRDLIDFCTLMTFQSKVGVPLIQALTVACQDCESPDFRKIMLGLQHHLESGLLFYESLEKYPAVFPPYFANVIRAGETSSKLPEAFDNLRKYLEWMERMMAEVRQATMYPAIVMTVVFGFIIGLFSFVIPKFEQLLLSVHVQLPLLTQIIFGMSRIIKTTWWLWLLALPLSVAALFIARRMSRKVDLFVDRVKLRLPIFGEINTMLAISRFAHNLAILYRSGIPIVQSLHLCRGLVGSAVVSDAVAAVEEAVKTGSTMSEAFRRQTIFPPLLLRMVIMGETTGNLDVALDNVADYYNEIVPRRIKALLTVLEPMLTIGMIVLVGCVAIAIYLPILSLMGSIH